MEKILKQLGIENGEVYFRKYENYNCSLLDGNTSATNYCLAIKTEGKAYIFFKGSTYRKLDITVTSLLIDCSEDNILKVIGEPLDYGDGSVIDYNDDIAANDSVIANIDKLIENNATWIEDEVETLMSKYGINISLFLAPDQIDNRTVEELRKSLEKAESASSQDELIPLTFDNNYEPEQTLITSDGSIFDVEPQPDEVFDIAFEEMNSFDEEEYAHLISMEENRYY